MRETYFNVVSEKGFPGGSDGKESAMQETQVRSLGQEDPLEKGMAPHSSILTWRIPWIEEPGVHNPWDHEKSDMTEWLTLLHSSEWEGRKWKRKPMF